MRKLVFAACLAVLVASCGQPSSPSDTRAQAIVDSLNYVQDTRNGLCFGVTTAPGTAHANASYVVVEVPCDRVQAQLQ